MVSSATATTCISEAALTEADIATATKMQQR
jgi:hypothetical protein